MKHKYGSFISVLIIFLGACAGGTSGSGIKTYEGKIVDLSGSPQNGVTLTLESTGDTSISNEKGKFTIISQAHGDEVPLLVESKIFQDRVVIRNVGKQSSLIVLNLKVDTVTNKVSIENLKIKAQMVGLCDHYFENREYIRQANRIASNTKCSINVEVRDDKGRLPNIPLLFQVAACNSDSPWRTLKESSTGRDAHKGFSEINFTFKDSPQFCRYRVSILSQNFVPIAQYALKTFTQQNYEVEKK